MIIYLVQISNSRIYKTMIIFFKSAKKFNLTRKYSNLKFLPFIIKPEQAETILKKHNHFLESEGIEIQPLKSCYIPFHSVEINNLNSNFIGKYGI